MSSRGKVIHAERETVNGKPVVHFSGSVTFHPAYDKETGEKREYAVVYGVQDHPRLGRQKMQPVYTSMIELKCEDGKSFETANTFYKRVEASSAGRTWGNEGSGPSLG